MRFISFHSLQWCLALLVGRFFIIFALNSLLDNSNKWVISMLASVCCLFTHIHLDCILDILSIMLEFSGSWQSLLKNVDIFLLADIWPGLFQFQVLPYGSYGLNVTSFVSDFAVLFGSVLCVFHPVAILNPGWWSALQLSSQSWWYAIIGQSYTCVSWECSHELINYVFSSLSQIFSFFSFT